MAALQLDDGYTGPDPDAGRAPPVQALNTEPAPAQSPSTGSAWDDAEGFAPTAPPSKKGALRDFGDQVWAGTLQMGEGALGFASAATRALTSDPETVSWIEKQKHGVAEHVQKTVEGMSPKAQMAMRASLLGGKDEQGNDLPTPGEAGWGRYIGASVAGMVPQLALAMLPGGIVGRVASAIAFGAIDSGEAYNHIVDAVDKATPEQLRNSPVYAHLRDQGVSDAEARQTLVARVAPGIFAARFAVGTLAGAGIGGLLTRGAAGAAGRGAVKRLGIGAAEGAGVMGGQAGADTALEQQGDIRTGVKPGFDPDEIARRAATGFIGGAVVGGAGGLLHGRPRAPREAPPAGVAVDEHAALVDTLPKPPEAPAPTPEPPPVAPEPPTDDGFPPRIAGKVMVGPDPGARPEVRPEAPVSPTEPAKGPTEPPPVEPPAPVVEAPPTVVEPARPVPGIYGGEPDVSKGPFEPPGSAAPTGEVAPTRLTTAQVQARDGVGANEARRRAEAENAARVPVPETPKPTAPSADEASSEPTPAQAILQKEIADAQDRFLELGRAVRDADGTRKAALEAQRDEAHAALRDAGKRNTSVDEAAARAVEPTPAQAEAGNYTKGHTNVGGLDIAIETPKGGVRRGVGPDGKPWEATMPAHYGYVKRTEGADGDHLDVSLGPHADAATAHPVFVVDQIDPKSKTFDEHKAMVGFASRADALAAYDGSFSDGSGPTRRGAVTDMPFDQFKTWAGSGDTKTPLAFKPKVGDTLRAKAAAARAARKAEMAPPGERIRGQVETIGPDKEAPPVPDTAPRVTFPAERTHSETTFDARAALHTVTAREIVPLSKGEVGKAAAIASAEREVTAALKGTRSEQEVIDALVKWGKRGDMIAGTKSRRIDIADRVLRLLTNKSFDQHTGRDVRLARDLASEPKPRSNIIETEGVARVAAREELHAKDVDAAHAEDLERPAMSAEELARAGEGESSGVADYKGVEEKPLAPSTTDLSAIGKHWLNRVTTGRATAQEAAQVFGVQKPGPGRPRAFKDFAAYLDHAIAEALDPATAGALRERIIQLESGKTGLHAQALKVEGNKIDALMARTGEAYVKQLRDIKAELDPVGEAVQANQPYTSRGEVNAGVADTLRRAQDRGTPLNLHTLLRQILTSREVRDRAAPFAGLARRLLQIAPDLEVLTPDQALARGLELDHYSGFMDGKREGQYTPPGAYGKPDSAAYIVVNPNGKTPVETTLHEALHSITSGYITELQRTPTSPGYLALMAIGREVNRVVVANRETLTPTELQRAQYALTNSHELHTMLMSSPELHAILSRTEASPEMVRRLRELGFSPGAESRTVWQTFTNWVRKVLGLDQKSGSALDQIMRPAQDIADRAAEHNDNLLPEDRVLRGFAEPLANMLTDNLKGTTAKIFDRVDFMGLGDKARTHVLQAVPTDGIVKWNREMFAPSDRLTLKHNPLVMYRTVTERIGRVFHETTDRYGDRVRDLTGRLRGAETSGLAKLMNDATLGEHRLGTADPTDATPELAARFDALSAADKATYRATRDHYAETYKQEREAQLGALVRTVMPDADAAQVAALSKTLRSPKSIDELIKGADPADVAAAFGHTWDTQRELAKGIARAFKQGFVSGDYFPLRRFGNYVLRYGSAENANYGVEMFESRGKAEARRAELLKSGAESLTDVLDRRTSNIREVMNNTLADRLHDRMVEKGMTADQASAARDVVNSIMLEQATRSEAVRTKMRRAGVEGASTDAARVLAREFLAFGTRMGYLEHGDARARALADMRLVVDDLGKHASDGSQIRASAVLKEVEKRVAAGDHEFGGLVSAMRRATTFGYVQSLMSPSHMLVNTIEIHMNSTALLGARHGVGRAGLALTKALADVSPRILGQGARNTLKAVGQGLKTADWNLSHLARDRLIAKGADRGRMTDLFKAIDDAGLVDHTMIQEMRRIAGGGFGASRAGRAWDRFMDFNAAGAHAVDVANKSAVAKAAYDLEYRKTGDHKAAVEHAVEMLRQVTPNYNLGNKARIATDKGVLGGLAGPIMQFKMYGIHMYSVIANLAKASVHGASKADRYEARKAFAGILATHAMMAGVLTLIADPLRWVGGAYDFFTSTSGRPHDYQNDVRAWMSDIFGPELGELLARGAPHAVGIDLHKRVGLDNMLAFPDLKSFDKKGLIEAIGTVMTGASGEDAAAMVGGLGKVLRGDWNGFKDMVPRVIRDPMKAGIVPGVSGLADKGVTDSTGKTILKPEKLSVGDIAAQALGFQPARVSEFREGRQAVLEARQEASAEHAHLTKAWLQAEPIDRAAVMSDIRVWNMEHPSMRITVTQLMQQLHTQRASATKGEKTFGLTLPKKSSSVLAREGQFANVN